MPLQSLPTLHQINILTQLAIPYKLTTEALDPLVQIIDEDVKQDQTQDWALRNTTRDQPPAGFDSSTILCTLPFSEFFYFLLCGMLLKIY